MVESLKIQLTVKSQIIKVQSYLNHERIPSIYPKISLIENKLSDFCPDKAKNLTQN